MEANVLELLSYGVVNIALVLLLAPLFEGVLRKVTARVQSRQGPPITQPYYDLLKLLGKEDLECGESPFMQRFASYLSLAAILTVALLVPIGAAAPLGLSADSILLIYVLTLCGISTLLAALAAGSTYSLVGMSREMMAMMTLEPLLAISVIIGAVHAGSLRLDDVLGGGAVYAAGAESISYAGILMAVVMLFAFQAFVGRMPFDIAEAETELMEGTLIEYSGPKLALFKYAQMAKLFLYSAIVVALFLPWGNSLAFPLGTLVVLAKIFGLTLLVTLIAATHARYRIDQAIKYYAFLFIVALIALILAVLGY